MMEIPVVAFFFALTGAFFAGYQRGRRIEADKTIRMIDALLENRDASGKEQ